MKTEKNLLRIILTLTTVGLLVILFYFFVYKGNNRLTIWYNHGLWLPNNTTNIKFKTYPAFIVLTDDWAKSNCTMKKKDFQDLINKLQWCDRCYGIGNHFLIPDSLKNKYPLQAEFKSPIGDFLIIYANEIKNDELDVYMYTDWN